MEKLFDIEIIPKLKNSFELFKDADLLIDLHPRKLLECASPPKLILEAMSSKTIVVSSDIPEIKEIIKDNKNGFLIKTNSPKEISKKIKEALKLKKNIKENARKTILKNYDLERLIQRYEKLYERFLKKD